jgi:hypothetical protein
VAVFTDTIQSTRKQHITRKQNNISHEFSQYNTSIWTLLNTAENRKYRREEGEYTARQAYSSSLHRLSYPNPDDGDCGAAGGMKICRGNRSILKTCPSGTLFATNPSWREPGSNPGCRCWKPETNYLSYGTAVFFFQNIFGVIRIYSASVNDIS